MSYPPPPGVAGASTPPVNHPSLPARPPPSHSTGFKPAFASASPTPGSYAPAAAPSYPAPTTHTPGAFPAPAPSQYGAAPQSYSAGPTVSAPPYQSQAYQYPQQASYAAPSSYAATPSPAAYSTPQIRNPFPLPGSANDSSMYDAEMAAQVAQWQSAYVSKDATAARDGAPGGGRMTANATSANAVPVTTPAAEAAAAAAATAERPEKKETVVREGGGKKWTDDSLLEWDPSHLRLFVGNLAGEVTDDSLLKAFARWKSVQKARVIREKRTSKSKNFGFVSFSDPDDYFQAAKEMNGKYIQSHPVIVTRAKTEVKPSVVKERDNRKKNGKKGKRGNNNQSFEPSLAPTPGAGVQKPGQKTKNGLKLLG